MSDAVYMIGMIDVKDFQTYAEQYGMPEGEMFAEDNADDRTCARLIRL